MTNVVKAEEEIPDRTTISRSGLADVYKCIRYSVMQDICSGTESMHIAMTFDIWTDNARRRPYITFTLHHITNNFVLRSYTLCTRIIYGK